MSFVTGLLTATVTATTPILLAGLGELISERAGVLNLGIEGIMLAGALSGFAVTVETGDPTIGFISAIGIGILISSIHAFLTISLKADQVVSGVMLTLLGTGFTTFLGAPYTSETITGFADVSFPVVGSFLSGIPIVGPSLFQNPPPDYIALLSVPIVWYLLFHSNLGLRIRATGEDPETADSAGINVGRIRYLCVLLSGAFAGAGGAALSLAFSNVWVPGMIAGRGWIAVALVIFAQWNPSKILLGSYLFGVIQAFAIRSQEVDIISIFDSSPLIQSIVGTLLEPTILPMYPYLVTILILVYISRKGVRQEIGAPSALLEPYIREED